ncbi:hypothetical protein BB560_006810 [Smittium megazygosporum]|uniref:Uncharacterized protein n=1 Tax=Smittium megazygosporum TaxID=133381 RepID=A0A2T9Y1A7_9FUNG|nr:hypothetical protein BB560_006810 [Smittium megazygosporum]
MNQASFYVCPANSSAVYCFSPENKFFSYLDGYYLESPTSNTYLPCLSNGTAQISIYSNSSATSTSKCFSLSTIDKIVLLPKKTDCRWFIVCKYSFINGIFTGIQSADSPKVYTNAPSSDSKAQSTSQASSSGDQSISQASSSGAQSTSQTSSSGAQSTSLPSSSEVHTSSLSSSSQARTSSQTSSSEMTTISLNRFVIYMVLFVYCFTL